MRNAIIEMVIGAVLMLPAVLIEAACFITWCIDNFKRFDEDDWIILATLMLSFVLGCALLGIGIKSIPA